MVSFEFRALACVVNLPFVELIIIEIILKVVSKTHG